MRDSKIKAPRKVRFSKATDVPNTYLPALLFRGVLRPHTDRKAERFRKAFRENGWTGLWTDTIYDYTAFPFERARGSRHRRRKSERASWCDGGRLFRLKPGDMLVLPASATAVSVPTTD